MKKLMAIQLSYEAEQKFERKTKNVVNKHGLRRAVFKK